MLKKAASSRNRRKEGASSMHKPGHRPAEPGPMGSRQFANSMASHSAFRCWVKAKGCLLPYQQAASRSIRSQSPPRRHCLLNPYSSTRTPIFCKALMLCCLIFDRRPPPALPLPEFSMFLHQRTTSCSVAIPFSALMWSWLFGFTDRFRRARADWLFNSAFGSWFSARADSKQQIASSEQRTA